MADELDNKLLKDAIEESKKTLETLGREVTDSAREFKNITSEVSQMRKSLAMFSTTQRELNSSLAALKSPIISSIANALTNNLIAREQIAVKRKEIEQTQKSIAAKQSEVKEAREKHALALMEKVAVQSKVDQILEDRQSAAAAAKAEHEAKQSIVAELQDEVARRSQLLANAEADAMASKNPYLERDRAKVAELNELLARAKEEEAKSESGLATANKAAADRTTEHDKELERLNKEVKRHANSVTELTDEEENLQKTLVQQRKELMQMKVSKLVQSLKDVSNVFGTFVGEIRQTQQAFGIAAGQAAKLNFGNFVESLQSYANVFSGAAPVTAEEIKSAQQAFQAEFGGVVTPEAAKEIAINAKQLGVTTSQLAVARRQFMTATMGNVGAAATQQDKFISEFQKKGLTSKDALDAIAQNSEVFARNGTRFATSFARAAADAKKIGVDLGKIDQVGDNIIGDFEGFLEKTAELGAMGFGFDSQRLAEVAESGDTGALMGELRSQLAAQGKDLTNLRRSEQLALSQAFGIPMAELQRLAQQQTDGSGEQLTEQEKATTFLSRMVNRVEKLAGWLSIIASLIGGAFTVATIATSINTARIAASLGATGNIFRSGVDMLKGGFTRVRGMFGGGAGPTSGGSMIPGGPSDAMRRALELRRANPGLSAADALSQAKGGGTSIASTATSAAPAAGQAAGGATSGISKLSSGINPTSLIKGAAAMVIMAGALWILGKALQQFSKVGLREVGVAAAAITIMAVLMAGLGALMSSGIGAGAILLGVGALILMAGAVYLMGKALQSVGNSSEGISKLSSSFDLLASAVGKLLAMDLDDLDKIKDLAKAGVGQTATALAKKAGVPEAVPGTTVATPGVSVTTPPSATTTPLPTVNVDFTRLEQKLDQVVKVIGSMKVELDGVKVGNIMANTSSNVRLAGVLGAST